MERLTSKQFKQLLDFLRAGYACREQEAFVTHLLSGLSTLIPSEFTGYAEVDLRTGWVGELRAMPAEIAFPGHRDIFAAYMPEHPIPTYYQKTGNGRAVKISDFLTQRQFHRLGLYQEIFRRVGVEDEMAVSLVGQGSSAIGVTLNRSRWGDFSGRERLLLDLLRPHLVQAYANAQAVGAMRQEISLTRQALETHKEAIVVLSREGRVRWMTPRAHDWLTVYFGPIRAEQLPEALETWRTHQEAALSRADIPPPREPLRVQRNGTCLLVRHLCEADRCLLLLQEQRTASEPATFQRDGLTRREAEVLQWVAQGKTNAEIGIILDMSPGTVKKHLQRVYDKLGVETRTAAAALALGWHSEG